MSDSLAALKVPSSVFPFLSSTVAGDRGEEKKTERRVTIIKMIKKDMILVFFIWGLPMYRITKSKYYATTYCLKET